MVHVRRKFFDVHATTGSVVARALYCLIETAKLNGVDPEAYLRDVLDRIADHPASRLTDLLPWTWAAAQPNAQAA